MSIDITQAIVRIISDTTGVDVDNGAVGQDDDLYDAGLKSLAAVRLMLALEEEFNIELPDSILHRRAFSTIARIRDTLMPLLAHCGDVE